LSNGKVFQFPEWNDFLVVDIVGGSDGGNDDDGQRCWLQTDEQQTSLEPQNDLYTQCTFYRDFYRFLWWFSVMNSSAFPKSSVFLRIYLVSENKQQD